MRLSNRQLLALTIATASGNVALAGQSESQGFIEDSHLNFLTRNLYYNHDYHSGHNNADSTADRDRREWGQAFRFDYTSGFTQGTVGFGLDASVYTVMKLDGGAGHSGQANVLVTDGNSTAGEASSGGANVKLRISETELKYGNNLRPYNAVFAPADARLTPGTAQGFWLTSKDVEGLSAEAAHLTAAKDFNSTNTSDDFYAAYAGVASSTVDFVGATYSATDRLILGLYGAEYKDIWRQYYGNLNYTYPISDTQSLNFDANLYRTLDEGRALAGDISTTAYSLAAAYTVGAHTFKLTYQKIRGDQPFDYLGLGPHTFHDSIYLANSSQLADFNGPNEKSRGLFYSLDMASYGVKGLTFGARYILGRDVDGSKLAADSPYNFYGSESSEEHWERDIDVKYVVQEGTAKGLSLRLRQATHRIGNGASDAPADQIRLITEYPWSIF
ncbi:OprD family porin [Pseudomonas sp. TNT2022 ID1044]|uniref:OprD family porin n=1 Tax=Pseudomonas sp. TNT2022 ID1044 TaxID=2942636 RepID=UPI0023630A51|nr:OprD family porin [Pseudomonas sp. TNT2022 ID1044]MDD0998382.1 OprD family porin [Pseudomonas sp. TNT2022 ID1044]